MMATFFHRQNPLLLIGGVALIVFLGMALVFNLSAEGLPLGGKAGAKQCPAGYSDCKGSINLACCNADQECKISGSGGDAYCVYKEEYSCPEGTSACSTGGVLLDCCSSSESAYPSGNSCRYCVPTSCGENESACRDGNGKIKCCVGEGGSCINGGTTRAQCTQSCGEGKFECHKLGNPASICCNTGEICASQEGGPACIKLRLQTKPQAIAEKQTREETDPIN